ncbi:sensor histidine kinase [Vagococcus fluvialis]|uniref:sensor histidine kinase n=1 Tax=Vagococcus fluvialis TaxID=2738 RepID=UPI001A9061ED|nr:HAMP domain-containing sensor histidine kinase [Vagococcus fluvialis]MBO0487392.1 HAMP domain-containing histidine kinase [Vagococcus fluvialis]
MFLENMRKNKDTAQYQLTKKFISIFLVVLVMMNLLYLFASGKFVFEFVKNKSESTMNTLVFEENEKINWSKEVDRVISEKDGDGMIVVDNSGNEFFSVKAEALFNELYQGKSLPFIKPIIFSDEGIYYVNSKDYGDFTVNLATNSEMAVDLVVGMLRINIILNLLAIVIGSFVIYRSTKHWSRNLKNMSKEIRELDLSQQSQIKVPNNPLEIKEVALAFNQLLMKQEQAIEREKKFITNASHDLKTPIAAIRGHVKLIQRRGESHPEIIPKSLSFIDTESERLEKLSHQLLILNEDRNEFLKENINFSEIVEAEFNRNMSLFPRKYTSTIENNVMIQAVRSDLEQIVQNLIGNAIKYSTENEGIDIQLKIDQPKIIFSVSDNGIGIDEKHKNKIFERFFRVDDSRTSNIEGSGIGLAIVKEIVEKYQGKIIVKDNKPKGTIFIIEIPKN